MSTEWGQEIFEVRKNSQKSLTFETEGEWKGSYCFIQGADPQFGMIADWEERKQMTWDEEIQLTRKAIQKINAMQPKPKFFIVCGDLINAFPDKEYRKEQEKDFMREFSKVDPSIPLLCVCGNHDIGNTPTKQSIQNFRNSFGDDFYSFWVGGVKYIVLNSQLYEDPSLVMEWKEKQDLWLEKELNDHEKQFTHLVTFQHIPWFISQHDEENEYFNINKDIRIPMLEKLQNSGVKAIFCGHYHRNAGGYFKGMEEVVTSAMGCPLGKDGSGLRVVKVSKSAITHQYYAMDDIPLKVDLSDG